MPTATSVSLCTGYAPWSPLPHVEDSLGLHGYDHPFVGMFRDKDRSVLFACVEGFVDQASIWAYVTMSDDEATELAARKFDSVDELMVYVDELIVQRCAAVSAAIDDRIVVWAEVEPGMTTTHALNLLTRHMADSLRQVSKHVASASADLP